MKVVSTPGAPARSTVEVARLLMDVLVERECIATVGQQTR